MKCLYLSPGIEQVNQNFYVYDSDGKNTAHVHRLYEVRPLMECLREECAAWQGGRCRYNGRLTDGEA